MLASIVHVVVGVPADGVHTAPAGALSALHAGAPSGLAGSQLRKSRVSVAA